ncbi:hypothetical protein IBL26_04915 [Roseomonas aerophila]|uniref:Uncharacterized protein n=1 Tax=Teichococcus aerophilus TaxID=1224513 RepID=A0ABR7RIA4_9PROT|nr:hypothetical protein [Pseudoroseomonas aerophila]MBC9206168.1 hypothetical protein [Pseudoroseomonas aerophila]
MANTSQNSNAMINPRTIPKAAPRFLDPISSLLHLYLALHVMAKNRLKAILHTFAFFIEWQPNATLLRFVTVKVATIHFRVQWN